MSKLDDNLKWIKQYRAGKLWLTKLKSKFTRKQYLADLKKYCDATKKNPDQLIELKLQGQRLAGTDKKFQAEELHDITISEMKATVSVRANISTAVQSFYKHNRRPLIQVKTFDRPTPKQRTPKLSDIQDMADVANNHRDKFIVWFLSSCPFARAQSGTKTKGYPTLNPPFFFTS